MFILSSSHQRFYFEQPPSIPGFRTDTTNASIYASKKTQLLPHIIMKVVRTHPVDESGTENGLHTLRKYKYVQQLNHLLGKEKREIVFHRV